jgi:intein/homing endonuclease
MKSLGQKKFKDKSPEEVNKILSDAWLNIVVDENKIFNPLTNIPDFISEKPHLYYTWLMMQPEYFSFLASEILNVNILPFQSVILSELWNRKFPMLIGSRGLSKALLTETPVLSEDGWKPIIDIKAGERVYSRDGNLCNVLASTGRMKDLYSYKVFFEDGREIICCEDHNWLVTDDLDSLNPSSFYSSIDAKTLFSHTNNKKNPKIFSVPVNEPLKTTKDSHFETHPYLMGLILGSGYIIGDKVHLVIFSEKVKNKLSVLGILENLELEKDSKYIFDAPNSSIRIYENGSLSQRQDFMDGLLSQLTKDHASSYMLHHNQEVTSVIANIARSCGYYCYHKKYKTQNSKLLINNKKNIKIVNIQKFGKIEGCCIEVDSKDNTYITKDFLVTHNSFLMGLYSLIRAFLMPRRKIVICGAAFRQSKVVYEYAANIWHNSPLLRDIIGTSGNNGPRNMTDMCRLTLKDSMISALPIGCLSKDTLITTSDGIREMGDYSDQNFPNKIWSESSFKDVGFFFDNGLGNCKNIKTNLGYEYIGTPNHKMKIVRDNKIIWCRTDEMRTGDEILIDTSERWFNPSFEATDEMGYALGCMIGDGSYVRKERLQFTTIDPEFIPRLKCIGDFKIQKDGLHYFLCKSGKVKEWMGFWGLDYTYTVDKKLPNSLLSSSKSVVANCIAGIFDTDGHIFTSDAKGGMSISVNFTTISEKLAKQIQYILLHFGIRSSLRNRERDQILRGKKSNSSRVYELMISGPEVVKFYQKIPIKLSRKKTKLENALSLKTKFNSVKNDYVPVNKDLLIEIVNEFNIGHRFHIKDIERKKTITKNYLTKFISKCQELNINHNNLSILKDFINPNIFFDKITSIKDIDSVYTVDLNVPSNNTYTANGFISHNTGDKIRGQRASDILNDEFSSIPRDIFETVIAGFASVSADPANNVKESAKKKMQELMGLEMDEEEDTIYNKTNQIAISGTAYYDFNHFATYWKKWHSIITSKGDPKKLSQIFQGEVPESFNWKDYSIMRIPYNLLPYGFMDQGQLARSKATVHSGIFGMEFECLFAKDSNGFFRRSLIESCTISADKSITIDGKEVIFDAIIKGDPKQKYVYAIDPASESDNLSIVILEIRPNHRRVVYCWTTNRKQHIEKVKAKIVSETDFYSYCAKKIRELMKTFPAERIAIDSQGGGIAIIEALHDSDKIGPNEVPLWEIIENGKSKPSDVEQGLHIIEKINFASAEFTAGSNHGLRKDMEDKIILFPFFNAAALSASLEDDNAHNRVYDTLEDCMMEIEEMKNELTTIVVTQTSGGREHWDTPEVKLPGMKKGKLRKDRYSSLLMANYSARNLDRAPKPINYETTGGFAETSNKKESGVSYIGTPWLTNAMNGLYD